MLWKRLAFIGASRYYPSISNNNKQRGHLQMSNIKNRKEGGFTIIEVLIVLAIAGLIMLIVFLAVPALQRTSRNTQRKNDASAISSAVANFISNNGGTLPAGSKTDTDANTVDICATTPCGGNTETAKLGYYTPANVSVVTSVASPTTPTKDTVVVDTGYSCSDTNTGLGTASSRTAAILYAVETGSSGISQQCVEQ
jgi:prepilin-type N-terminal cleavage/methylation domain-containing protein